MIDECLYKTTLIANTGYSFHQFFNHVDNYREPHFLYLTSKGIEATKRDSSAKGKSEGIAKLDMESDDEAGAGGEEG